MKNSRNRTGTAILCTLGMLLLGACGGSDDPSSATSAAPVDDSTEDSPAPEASTDEESPAPEASSGGGGASVTIGGDSYSFSPEQVRICFVDEKGIFKATIANDDFTQNVDLSLPPDGYVPDDPLFAAEEYASVAVTLSDEERWVADAYESDPLSVNNRNIPAGQTQVDSYQFDAASASGSATFLNMQALTIVEGGFTGDPVPGSFEVTCN